MSGPGAAGSPSRSGACVGSSGRREAESCQEVSGERSFQVSSTAQPQDTKAHVAFEQSEVLAVQTLGLNHLFPGHQGSPEPSARKGRDPDTHVLRQEG